ncbi:glycerol-3-phosphate dehydrogenase C-terminal domain-containing protein [Rubrobacter marinus]|uniref:glycerol-3-phosphate dehydrogenase C-terminal domain-containing protein n=1 Tax=Rubrobacter marinus TaxID=2653852 RepID=UPI001A9EC6E1|nr:glycerol-3-phosphate dehydrogenase C-terminal domain-containing protein [Rubrobacter marinus]
MPLAGGETSDFGAFSAGFKLTSGLTDDLAGRMLKLYGTRAPNVLAEAGDDHSLRVPLSATFTPGTGIIGAEVLYALRRELAVTLGDVLLRRTMVGMGPKVGLDVDRAAARVAVEHLGRTGERAEREVAAFREYVRLYKPRDLREMQPAGA